MKKRVFAALLTLVLALSLLPTGVFAYVGPIRTTESERKEVRTFTLTNGGVTYLCLQNDYITFAVQASGSGAAPTCSLVRSAARPRYRTRSPSRISTSIISASPPATSSRYSL